MFTSVVWVCLQRECKEWVVSVSVVPGCSCLQGLWVCKCCCSSPPPSVSPLLWAQLSTCSMQSAQAGLGNGFQATKGFLFSHLTNLIYPSVDLVYTNKPQLSPNFLVCLCRDSHKSFIFWWMFNSPGYLAVLPWRVVTFVTKLKTNGQLTSIFTFFSTQVCIYSVAFITFSVVSDLPYKLKQNMTRECFACQASLPMRDKKKKSVGASSRVVMRIITNPLRL